MAHLRLIGETLFQHSNDKGTNQERWLSIEDHESAARDLLRFATRADRENAKHGPRDGLPSHSDF